MKVISVQRLNDKFEECDITTATQNFYVKAGDTWLLIHNSPSLIMGWINGQFMLTDKAGFSAKSYNGLTLNSQDIEQMILNRKVKLDTPEALQARAQYAKKIAQLYPLLKQVVPSKFKGFVQGDLLWVGAPVEQDGYFIFKPNKIKYSVPQESALGRQIATSKMGIVFHSRLTSPQDSEPDALGNPELHGIHSTSDVVAVPHEMQFERPFQINIKIKQKIEKLITSQGTKINALLNPISLSDNQIKGLPGVMKSFLAHKASEGDSNLKNAAQDFITFLQSDRSKVSDKAKSNMLEWIKTHAQGYGALWQAVSLLVDLKLELKSQMDHTVGDKVQAHLAHEPGHEGFVSVTDQGIVKLVNRAQFMSKHTPLSEAQTSTHNHRVVFSFLRANPPTLGHKLVVDKVAQHAGTDDYWVFFSHSQDPKKNPLDWKTKVQFVKKIMTSHAPHVITQPDIKTPLQAANWLYAQGYTHLTMVVGSDRVNSMTDLLNGWNSPEVAAKDNRKPIQVQVVSAGERDPDAEGLTGISGTKARQAVQQQDLPAFEKFTGLDGKLAKQLFTSVALAQQSKGKSTIKESQPQGHLVKLVLCDASAKHLYDWCISNRIPAFDPAHMHLTVMSCEQDTPHVLGINETQTKIVAQPKKWCVLGTSLVLEVDCTAAYYLHRSLKRTGCVHKWPSFIPHVSVNYDWHTSKGTPSQVPPFELVFDQIKAEGLDPNFSFKVMN